MAVVIRLRRTGRKNLACFRITATDSRFPRDGKTLETLGLYDPLRRDAAQQVKLDEERTRWWIEHGAVPSEIMQSIFKRLKLFPKKPHVKRDRSGRKPNAATVRKHASEKGRIEAKQARLQARRKAKKTAAATPAEAKG